MDSQQRARAIGKTRASALLKQYAQTVALQAHTEVTKRAASANGKHQDCWTATDTAHALKDCSRHKYLGLVFYDEDPLPRIQSYFETRKQPFLDAEFPVHRSVRLPHVKQNIPFGFISQSNCIDFVRGKRPHRVAQYMSRQWTWKRDIPDATLFLAVNRPSPTDVLQGAVGNCGFCAAFASLVATAPSVIIDAFGTLEPSNCGAVSVRLHVGGKFRYLLMDDYLLCKSDSYESPSVHSPDSKVLWVRLLEKAFVKLQGSYASLDGLYKYKSLYRHPARVLQCLTGSHLAMEVYFQRTKTSHDDVFRVLTKTQNHFVRVVHCRETRAGLRSNHGYSLLWVGEVGATTTSSEMNESPKRQLVVLRNPHGRGSYRGPYGHGCKIWTSSEGKFIMQQLQMMGCLRVFNLRALAPAMHDNGVFCMEFRSFMRSFPIMTVVGVEESADQEETRDVIYQLNDVKHFEQIIDAIGK